LTGGGRGFCVGFRSFPAGGSLAAGGVRLGLASEDCAAGFGEIKETPRDVAEGWEDERLRAGTSPDGREMGAGFEGEF